MSKKKRKKKTGIEKIWTVFKVQLVLLVLIIGAIAYYYVGGYAIKVSMEVEPIIEEHKECIETIKAIVVVSCSVLSS